MPYQRIQIKRGELSAADGKTGATESFDMVVALPREQREGAATDAEAILADFREIFEKLIESGVLAARRSD